MRRQAERGRLPRLLVALAIMLVAVLPHATFAATTLPMAHAPAGHSAIPGHHRHASASTPCDEADKPAHKAAPLMPVCCILGCGLLASVPDIGSLAVATTWRAVPAATAQSGESALIEPAERPPRLRLAHA
jgi:hypothetical protein